MSLSLTAKEDEINVISLPEQRILLSSPITGAYDDDDFIVASEFSLRLKSIFGLYDNFGSRISAEQILRRQYHKYDCFFAYGRTDIEIYDVLRPAGTYLRTYCIGSWDRLHTVYDKICNFAAENELELYGYAYEEGLNEMSLRNRQDYITMITIPCKKKAL